MIEDKENIGENGLKLIIRLLLSNSQEYNFETVLKRCKLSKNKFNDNDFPPNICSLINYSITKEEIVKIYNSLVWKRLSDIYPDSNLFKSKKN